MLMKRGFETALCILSKKMCVANGRRISVDNALKKSNYLVLHHDVSLIKVLLSLFSVYRTIRRTVEVVRMIYFIDTYSPAALLRNITGWFLAQLWSSYIVTSRYTYRYLKRFLVVRSRYLPIWRLYRFHIPRPTYRRDSEAIRIVYIGVIDGERFNTREIAKLVYGLHKAFGRDIELYVVARPDQNAREADVLVRPWLRVVITKKFLNDYEKQELLRRCHVVVFTAKRIRFVLPPLSVVEAHSCRCLVYAPNLADVLKEEGLSDVYRSIDELVDAIRKLMV